MPEPPKLASNGSFPPPDLGELPSDYADYSCAGREVQPDVGAGVTLRTFSEKARFCGGSGGGHNGGELCVGDQTPALEPISERIDVTV